MAPKKKISITLADELVDELEQAAEQSDSNRSELVEAAVRSFLLTLRRQRLDAELLMFYKDNSSGEASTDDAWAGLVDESMDLWG